MTRAPQPIRTFDEVFAELHLTPGERAALVWHLAAFRARKTVEALLPEPALSIHDPRHPDYEPRELGDAWSGGFAENH